MKSRKKLLNIVVFVIRVLVLISLISTILELRNSAELELTQHIYFIGLVCYLLTLVLERVNNLPLQIIVGMPKIFIMILLISQIIASMIISKAMPLLICDIIACVGYIEEQGFRLIYWLKKE